MHENDFKRIVDAGVADSKSHFDEAAERISAEMCRHFDAVAEERQQELRLIGEQLTRCGEKLHREADSIRDEMRRGFAETQALLKFGPSHEDAGAKGRIERIEESTN